MPELIITKEKESDLRDDSMRNEEADEKAKLVNRSYNITPEQQS